MSRSHLVVGLAVICLLCTVMARADSINNLEFSVTSLSSCPTTSCFLWDPQASSMEGWLPASGGTFSLDSYLYNDGLHHPPLEITRLVLRLALPASMAANLTCGGNIFANCTMTSWPKTTVIILSGGTIYPSETFSLNFGCSNGACSWPGGMVFTANWSVNNKVSATAPEPGTITLLLTGMGALLSQRGRWFRRV
jgi:hypothetical protein